ncbi:MAG: hypothetical protein NC079_03040 [Clostridium sp.]|nr:hypothetical protein [Acetatifactor muris]MCM1525893.1 hypothetical protein [Bacteroides sp.]MCM1562567.1 hypothetical protein [Clostridium sp.]
MSKKIYYGSFAIMAFKFGAYVWTSWFLAFISILSHFNQVKVPWYVDVFEILMLCLPFAAPVILLILGLVCGYKWVMGWRWWNAIGMLTVGTVAFVFPIAIAAGYIKATQMLGVW